MKRPIFVRPLTDAERRVVNIGLRSPDAFTLRRCQILLASARREQVPALGCDERTVRTAIHAFNAAGQSHSPRLVAARTVHAAFDATGAARLPDVLHRRPRDFGHVTSHQPLDAGVGRRNRTRQGTDRDARER